jgi:hypothetical protein
MGDSYDDSEPRDAGGRWTSGGGGGSAKTPTTQESHSNMDKVTQAAHGQGRFSESQLSQLRAAFERIKTVDPEGNGYKGMVSHLDKMSQAQLKQVGGANIKFMSALARNRVHDSGGYNPQGVNQAIRNAGRYQGKVSGREARAIHALLKGRH